MGDEMVGFVNILHQTILAMKRGHPRSSGEEQAWASVIDWLTNLRLLKGVPFPYIVPHEAMLPNDSIRFFHLDRNWVDALVDGALSTGVLDSRGALADIDPEKRAALYTELMEALNEQELIDNPFRHALSMRESFNTRFPGIFSEMAIRAHQQALNHASILMRQDDTTNMAKNGLNTTSSSVGTPKSGEPNQTSKTVRAPLFNQTTSTEGGQTTKSAGTTSSFDVNPAGTGSIGMSDVNIGLDVSSTKNPLGSTSLFEHDEVVNQLHNRFGTGNLSFDDVEDDLGGAKFRKFFGTALAQSMQEQISNALAQDDVIKGGLVTGFLMRSSIVRDYPGIEISAYYAPELVGEDKRRQAYETKPLELLRVARLSESILLCMFKGIPTHLRIQEPSEGIRLGVDAPAMGANQRPHYYQASYKDIDGNIVQNKPVNIAVRAHTGDPSVLKITDFLNSPADDTVLTWSDSIEDENARLTQGGYVATQLMQFPYQQDFQYDSITQHVLFDQHNNPIGHATVNAASIMIENSEVIESMTAEEYERRGDS